MDKEGAGGGSQLMWIIIKFHNIIIKSANMDKGGGVSKTLIHKMWIKRHTPHLYADPFGAKLSILTLFLANIQQGKLLLVCVYCLV